MTSFSGGPDRATIVTARLEAELARLDENLKLLKERGRGMSLLRLKALAKPAIDPRPR